MTNEIFEKAIDLKAKMDYLVGLQWLFGNAAQEGATISAISPSGKPFNTCVLTEEMHDKFVALIQKEYDETKKEFEKL